MEKDQFQPTDAQIDAVLAKYTPRQIAAAYLRASRRARQAETAFELAINVADFGVSALTGDLAGAKAAVNRAEKVARTNQQASEART